MQGERRAATRAAGFNPSGARVAIVDIDERAGIELCDRQEAQGPSRPLFQVADLRDIAGYQNAMAMAQAALGPIAVNLSHHFFAIRAAAPGMR